MVNRDIVVIGASAGGVGALTELVSHLPRALNATVFIVLHIPVYARTELPAVLSRSAVLPVKLAQDGAEIERGTIYVAPNDHHLVLRSNRIRLTKGPRENRVRPCIDVLFRSAAIEFGSRVIGIVLTGLLDDGTAGLWAIKDRQGITITQEPSTAEYPDMPFSAIRHVEIDHQLSLRQIAETVGTLTAQQFPAPVSEAIPPYLKLETDIATEGNALKSGVLKIGELSANTCPECHGVLVKIQEGSIVRYRCHTGHAFSLETLLVEVDEAIDNGLWDGIRAIEERALILREMEGLERQRGSNDSADRRAREAEDAEQRAQRIRELVVGNPSNDPVGKQ
jgi:two-component system chemotaxis response regulator CheB